MNPQRNLKETYPGTPPDNLDEADGQFSLSALAAVQQKLEELTVAWEEIIPELLARVAALEEQEALTVYKCAVLQAKERTDP